MPPTEAIREPRWYVRAFGLGVDAGFPIAGVAEQAGAKPSRSTLEVPRTSLDILAEASLMALCDLPEATTLAERRGQDGRIVASVERHPEAGFVLSAEGFGRYLVSHDGAEILCAPPEGANWRWQRYLLGQALPLAAVLRGREVFHASAVVLRGRLLAFLGASSAGKSTIATELLLRGARFFTDDALALTAAGEDVMAHPGPGVSNLGRAALEQITSACPVPHGRRLGGVEDDHRVAIERHEQELPVSAIYVLDRRPENRRLALEELAPLDPRLLLAASFNFVIRTHDRLTCQLDVCARLARSARAVRAIVPPCVDAAALARAIEDHA